MSKSKYWEWPTVIGARVFKKSYHGYMLQAIKERLCTGETITVYELYEPNAINDDHACPVCCSVRKNECIEYAEKYPWKEGK